MFLVIMFGLNTVFFLAFWAQNVCLLFVQTKQLLKMKKKQNGIVHLILLLKSTDTSILTILKKVLINYAFCRQGLLEKLHMTTLQFLQIPLRVSIR